MIYSKERCHMQIATPGWRKWLPGSKNSEDPMNETVYKMIIDTKIQFIRCSSYPTVVWCHRHKVSWDICYCKKCLSHYNYNVMNIHLYCIIGIFVFFVQKQKPTAQIAKPCWLEQLPDLGLYKYKQIEDLLTAAPLCLLWDWVDIWKGSLSEGTLGLQSWWHQNLQTHTNCIL